MSCHTKVKIKIYRDRLRLKERESERERKWEKKMIGKVLHHSLKAAWHSSHLREPNRNFEIASSFAINKQVWTWLERYYTILWKFTWHLCHLREPNRMSKLQHHLQ